MVDPQKTPHTSPKRASYEQSGTKPNLVAKILATKFGFVPDWWGSFCEYLF